VESLESKLDRLSFGQRKEVEDFVDFLLSRSGPVDRSPEISCMPPPILDVIPPPDTLIEPVPGGGNRLPVPVDTGPADTPALPAAGEGDSALFREIGGGIQDRITHDYMDYGQYESHPSPASDAVKKVSRRIIARETQKKPHHLLDWVD
jgi:hypothetical protein